MQLQPFTDYRTDIYTFENAFLVDTCLEIEPINDYIHRHNVFELGIVLKGNGTFLINNEIKSFKEGDISVIYPGDWHISNSIDNNKTLWNYILIDATKLIAENPSLYAECPKAFYPDKVCSNVFSKEKSPIINDYVIRLYNELTAKEFASDAMSRYLFGSLLIEIYRQTNSNANISQDIAQNIEPIIPALSYITTHYTEDITCAQLAETCYISQTHLRRLFRMHLGMSPFEYIYKFRITAAKTLLRTTSLTVLEISQSVGYQSQTSFTKHFKQFTGTTPLKYKIKLSNT